MQLLLLSLRLVGVVLQLGRVKVIIKMRRLISATINRLWNRFRGCNKLAVVLLLLVLLVEICYLHYGMSDANSSDSTKVKIRVDTQPVAVEVKPKTIHLTLIVCGDRSNEMLTMTKSVIITTKTHLHFHIFTEDDLRKGLSDSISLWPDTKSGRVQFDFYPIMYPSWVDGDEWKRLYRRCTTIRLFIPNLLPKIDAAIYVDTDTIFLHDVEELWRYFSMFNSTQLAAHVYEHFDTKKSWYSKSARFKFVEPYGINAGVMLMNMTRIRNVNDWDKKLVDVRTQNRNNIKWADQDILNIFFAHHPELLFILPCRWNYRTEFCRYGEDWCPDTAKHGVFLLHGSRGVFHMPDFKKWSLPEFKTIYHSFESYNMTNRGALNSIVQSIRSKWKSGKTSGCQKELDTFLRSFLKYD